MVPNNQETAKQIIESVIQNEQNRGKNTIRINMDDPLLVRISQEREAIYNFQVSS
jgi:hypothetical protein